MTDQLPVPLQAFTGVLERKLPRSIEQFIKDPDEYWTRALKHAQKEAPTLFWKSETMFHAELMARIKKDYEAEGRELPSSPKEFDKIYQITPTEETLRLKFWSELERAEEKGIPCIPVRQWIKGICTREYLEREVLSSPVKMAWILTMPVEPSEWLDSLLAKGLGHLQSILDLPVVCPETGRVNNSLANTQTRIVLALMDRKYGMAAQNLNILAKNQTVNANLNLSMGVEGIKSVSEIEQKIHELEGQIIEAQSNKMDLS